MKINLEFNDTILVSVYESYGNTWFHEDIKVNRENSLDYIKEYKEFIENSAKDWECSFEQRVLSRLKHNIELYKTNPYNLETISEILSLYVIFNNLDYYATNNWILKIRGVDGAVDNVIYVRVYLNPEDNDIDNLISSFNKDVCEILIDRGVVKFYDTIGGIKICTIDTEDNNNNNKTK